MTPNSVEDFNERFGWDGNLLDLDTYLNRVGYAGTLSPTLDLLRQLIHAHTQSIPFENVDILLERELLLDIRSLQDKLVTRQRGGYCYEHNILFAAVVERLGYEVRALGARIMHSPDPDVLRSVNHSALLVTIGDRQYVVDVGTGSGPEGPIELRDGNVITTDSGWVYGVEAMDEFNWAVRKWDGRQWIYIHKFTLSPRYRVDYRDGSFVAQYQPMSPFRRTFIVCMCRGEQHIELVGTMFKIIHPDGTENVRRIAADEVPAFLVDTFGIALTDEEKNQLVPIAERIARAEDQSV